MPAWRRKIQEDVAKAMRTFLDYGLTSSTPLLVLGNCPNRKKHTPCPAYYVAYHEWAVKKMQTHTQTLCPACNRYEIWVPKKKKTTKRKG